MFQVDSYETTYEIKIPGKNSNTCESICWSYENEIGLITEENFILADTLSMFDFSPSSPVFGNYCWLRGIMPLRNASNSKYIESAYLNVAERKAQEVSRNQKEKKQFGNSIILENGKCISKENNEGDFKVVEKDDMMRCLESISKIKLKKFCSVACSPLIVLYKKRSKKSEEGKESSKEESNNVQAEAKCLFAVASSDGSVSLHTSHPKKNQELIFLCDVTEEIKAEVKGASRNNSDYRLNKKDFINFFNPQLQMTSNFFSCFSNLKVFERSRKSEDNDCVHSKGKKRKVVTAEKNAKLEEMCGRYKLVEMLYNGFPLIITSHSDLFICWVSNCNTEHSCAKKYANSAKNNFSCSSRCFTPSQNSLDASLNLKLSESSSEEEDNLTEKQGKEVHGLLSKPGRKCTEKQSKLKEAKRKTLAMENLNSKECVMESDSEVKEMDNEIEQLVHPNRGRNLNECLSSELGDAAPKSKNFSEMLNDSPLNCKVSTHCDRSNFESSYLRQKGEQDVCKKSIRNNKIMERNGQNKVGNNESCKNVCGSISDCYSFNSFPLNNNEGFESSDSAVYNKVHVNLLSRFPVCKQADVCALSANKICNHAEQETCTFFVTPLRNKIMDFKECDACKENVKEAGSETKLKEAEEHKASCETSTSRAAEEACNKNNNFLENTMNSSTGQTVSKTCNSSSEDNKWNMMRSKMFSIEFSVIAGLSEGKVLEILISFFVYPKLDSLDNNTDAKQKMHSEYAEQTAKDISEEVIRDVTEDKEINKLKKHFVEENSFCAVSIHNVTIDSSNVIFECTGEVITAIKAGKIYVDGNYYKNKHLCISLKEKSAISFVENDNRLSTQRNEVEGDVEIDGKLIIVIATAQQIKVAIESSEGFMAEKDKEKNGEWKRTYDIIEQSNIYVHICPIVFVDISQAPCCIKHKRMNSEKNQNEGNEGEESLFLCEIFSIDMNGKISIWSIFSQKKKYELILQICVDMELLKKYDLNGYISQITTERVGRFKQDNSLYSALCERSLSEAECLISARRLLGVTFSQNRTMISWLKEGDSCIRLSLALFPFFPIFSLLNFLSSALTKYIEHILDVLNTIYKMKNSTIVSQYCLSEVGKDSTCINWPNWKEAIAQLNFNIMDSWDFKLAFCGTFNNLSSTYANLSMTPQIVTSTVEKSKDGKNKSNSKKGAQGENITKQREAENDDESMSFNEGMKLGVNSRKNFINPLQNEKLENGNEILQLLRNVPHIEGKEVLNRLKGAYRNLRMYFNRESRDEWKYYFDEEQEHSLLLIDNIIDVIGAIFCDFQDERCGNNRHIGERNVNDKKLQSQNCSDDILNKDTGVILLRTGIMLCFLIIEINVKCGHVGLAYRLTNDCQRYTQHNIDAIDCSIPYEGYIAKDSNKLRKEKAYAPRICEITEKRKDSNLNSLHDFSKGNIKRSIVIGSEAIESNSATKNYNSKNNSQEIIHHNDKTYNSSDLMYLNSLKVKCEEIQQQIILFLEMSQFKKMCKNDVLVNNENGRVENELKHVKLSRSKNNISDLNVTHSCTPLYNNKMTNFNNSFAEHLRHRSLLFLTQLLFNLQNVLIKNRKELEMKSMESEASEVKNKSERNSNVSSAKCFNKELEEGSLDMLAIAECTQTKSAILTQYWIIMTKLIENYFSECPGKTNATLMAAEDNYVKSSNSKRLKRFTEDNKVAKQRSTRNRENSTNIKNNKTLEEEKHLRLIHELIKCKFTNGLLVVNCAICKNKLSYCYPPFEEYICDNNHKFPVCCISFRCLTDDSVFYPSYYSNKEFFKYNTASKNKSNALKAYNNEETHKIVLTTKESTKTNIQHSRFLCWTCEKQYYQALDLTWISFIFGCSYTSICPLCNNKSYNALCKF